MFRSVFSRSRKYSAIALVIVLALGVAFFYFTRQQPIPVTGANSVVRAQVAAPNVNVLPNQGGRTYLGDGRFMIVHPDGSQEITPKKVSNSGDGKLLIILPDGLQIFSAENVTK